MVLQLTGSIQRVNPVYTTFIAHRHPERCPLGALIVYFHYIMDVRKITELMGINWAVNKTWRRVSDT
jgi:hypothetical protein